MFRKLLVGLIACAFAMSAYAQAPKSGTEKAAPKGQTGTTTEKAEPGKGKSDMKGEKKKAKAKAKKDEMKSDEMKKEGKKKSSKKKDEMKKDEMKKDEMKK